MSKLGEQRKICLSRGRWWFQETEKNVRHADLGGTEGYCDEATTTKRDSSFQEVSLTSPFRMVFLCGNESLYI